MKRLAAGRRLLAATLRYPPYVAGGYELLTQDAVLGMRERGHHVQVLTGRGAELEGVPGVLPRLLPELDRGEDLFRRSFEGSNAERVRLHVLRLANWNETGRALEETGAELLLFFNLGLVSLAPLVAARARGVPTVGYVSDPWPENHWLAAWRADPVRRDGKPMRLELLERTWRAFRECVGLGRLLVPSTYLREHLAADGVPAESMRVLPLGVSAELEATAAGAAPRPRRAGEPLRVACTSMHWEGKGVHVLLEAAARAAQAGAELDLTLAGEGSDATYSARLRELAAEPRLAGRARFVGAQSREGISRLLAESHVLAFPSTWGEPFPLASLEAMAHGCALVASDAGGTHEQVEHGESGLVVPAGDAEALAAALSTLCVDDAQRLRLAAAGQTRVRERYTRAHFLDGLEAEVRAALGEGAR